MLSGFFVGVAWSNVIQDCRFKIPNQPHDFARHVSVNCDDQHAEKNHLLGDSTSECLTSRPIRSGDYLTSRVEVRIQVPGITASGDASLGK